MKKIVFQKGHKINVGRSPWHKDKKISKEEYPNWGMTGKTPWNIGLTKETDERIKIATEQGKQTQRGRHYSPNTEFKKGHKLSVGNKNHSWIDGRSYKKLPHKYGDNWNEIRKLTYKRDNYACQKCQKTKTQLHAHHIIPHIKCNNNSIDNLITLCASCHSTIEWEKRKGGIL